MPDKSNAPWAPQQGSREEDITEQACDMTAGGSAEASPNYKKREAYGGKVGNPINPKLGPGEKNDWQHQGYMVQPLPGGFAYPSSATMTRRDAFELNERDNFDPMQALPPRIKKSDTSS